MTLTLGIVTVRGPDYHPNERLLAAARAAGHRARRIHPYRLWPHVMDGGLAVTGEAATDLPQVILPRQGAQIGDSSLALIRQFRLMGRTLINGPEAIAIARDKFLTQQVLAHAGLPCLETVLVNDAAGFLHGVDRLDGYPLVVKPARGRQGEGVMRIGDAADARMRAIPRLDPSGGLILQRYLPPEGRQDIRAVVIGQEVICAGTLTPAAGDFRANFHLGGSVRPTSLSPGLAQLAVDAARTVGCDVAGVDIMIDAGHRPSVVEVNYAPGFKGMEAATGMDIADRIVKFAVQRYSEGKKTHP